MMCTDTMTGTTFTQEWSDEHFLFENFFDIQVKYKFLENTLNTKITYGCSKSMNTVDENVSSTTELQHCKGTLSACGSRFSGNRTYTTVTTTFTAPWKQQ